MHTNPIPIMNHNYQMIFHCDIHYENESLISNENINNSFKNYFVQFKHQYIDYYDSKNYFIEFYQDNNLSNDT